MKPKIDGVMYVVEDPQQALSWYSQLFDVEPQFLEAFNFWYLDINGYIIEFLKEDEKSRSGVNGQICYWLVDSFTDFVNKAVSLGATIYRGPIPIEQQQQMAQLKDPFNNVIGIRGR
jgi:predicted enzyme related to lactoylglutathione lyase